MEKKDIKQEHKYEFVKSMRLAGWLMWHGFNLVDIRPLRENLDMKIYKFIQTPELTKCIFEYINMRNGDENGINNGKNNGSISRTKC